MSEADFTLHGFPSVLGQASASPFVIKSMVQIALSNANAQVDLSGRVMKAPKGKLPYIEFPDGRRIGDSREIYAHLCAEYGLDLESWLTDEQRAQGQLYARAAEEHTYFAAVAYRWRHDENWRQIRDLYFDQMPALVRYPVAGMVRRKMLRDLKGQGLGLHDLDQIFDYVAADLESFGRVLGNKPYLFGDRLSYADTCVGTQVSGALTGEPPPAFARVIEQFPGLTDYAKRVCQPAHDFAASHSVSD